MSKDRKEYYKDYYKAHKEDKKAYYKDYYKAHKEEMKSRSKAYNKAYHQAHKEEMNDYMKDYNKSDVNSLGQTKLSIRKQSQYYLKKYGTKIPGYEIHHCCTYNEPYKFIYCSKEMHLKIHKYLRDNGIEADSNHFEQIKHLLDNTVVIYGV